MNIFKKKLTVYPTYGYRAEGDVWRIPMRAWVRNETPLPPDAVIRLCVDDAGDLNEHTLLRLKDCLRDFVANDNEGERVRFRFANDPEQETFKFEGKTDDNGLVVEEFTLPAARARQLLAAQGAGAEHGRLALTAETSGLSGSDESPTAVRLIPAEGLTVVSDIDDTIKVSEIPSGKRTALRRAFLMDYEATEGMRDRYLKVLERHPAFDNVAFHYVSGSPWQLFRLLHDFLVTATGFPEGAFHMKGVNINVRDFAASFRSVNDLLKGSEHTEIQKRTDISALFKQFPRRKFILVGDSGERDPEVFDWLKEQFPEQVLKIYIRDVKELGTEHKWFKDKMMLRIDTKGVCIQEDGS